MSDFLGLVLEMDTKEQSKIVDKANIIYSHPTKKNDEFEMDVNTALALVGLVLV